MSDAAHARHAFWTRLELFGKQSTASWEVLIATLSPIGIGCLILS